MLPLWNKPFDEAALCGFASKMEQTQQNPLYHGEGNVLIHTKAVCDALARMPEFRKKNEYEKTALYLAAMFHDIGKTRTTRMEDGRWISPHHSAVGAAMTRELLWQQYGLCGTAEAANMRELVCALVRYHSFPPKAIFGEDAERAVRKIAAEGELIEGFTVENLCLLAQADAEGRVSDDLQDFLERIGLCRELAKDAGCYTAPYPFPTAHTEFAYLSGRNVPVQYPLYDDTWGEVILMSGLPGTGKDTWIRENCSHLPVISLDEIRAELGILPTDDQGKVAHTAMERAKELLREKQPFVWNATNITADTRQKLVGLFAGYGASVKLVYLETKWDEQLRRNAERAAQVPETVICHMLEKLTPPCRQEAHKVQWNFV